MVANPRRQLQTTREGVYEGGENATTVSPVSRIYGGQGETGW
jgi:hypothetical protein